MQGETTGNARCLPALSRVAVRSLLRRYREPIFVAALLLWSFAIFAVKAKRPLSLSPWDRLVIALTAPIEKAIVLSVHGMQDAWSGYVALRGVREENLRLRGDLLRLKSENGRLGEIKAENDRLRRLLDYADKKAMASFFIAPVVAVGASPHSHVLRIARGSDDGVHRGMPVVAPDGVVGMVAVTTAHYADVQLIVSPTSAVPALSERSRARATVKGTGDVSRCKLEYAQRQEEWREGDLLLTAGSVGIFPQGLPIGRLVDVTKRPTGMFISAEVVPAVDFAQLDEVMVLQERRDAPPAPDGTTVNAATVGAPQ
jgi:rod shape-determining protein MreC